MGKGTSSRYQGETSLEEPIFIDFETVKEYWNWYRLKDETRIKGKLIVINIIQRNEDVFSVNTEKLFGAIPPEGKLGPAGKEYSKEELRKSVIADDLDFDVVEEHWNSYKIGDDAELKAKLTMIKISKTDKNDAVGIPYYLCEATPIFKKTKIKTE